MISQHCHQATNHYWIQCWPRSLLPYGVTRPQWVKGWLSDIDFDTEMNFWPTNHKFMLLKHLLIWRAWQKKYRCQWKLLVQYLPIQIHVLIKTFCRHSAESKILTQIVEYFYLRFLGVHAQNYSHFGSSWKCNFYVMCDMNIGLNWSVVECIGQYIRY